MRRTERITVMKAPSGALKAFVLNVLKEFCMNKIMHKIVLSLTLILQCFFGLLGSQGTANATTTPQQMGFQCNGQVVPIGTPCAVTNIPVQLIDNVNTPLMQRLAMSLGDARYVKNASGAIILAVPPGEASDTIWLKMGSTPQIWGAFNPSTGLARIQVIRATKNRGVVTLNFWDFSPKVMGPMAVRDGYHSVDPYASFSSPNDDFWHGMTYQAYLAIMGKAMLKNRTAIAYAAIASVRQSSQTTESGGLLSTSTTTTVQSFVKPEWYWGSSVENGGAAAFQTAFKVPNCNAATDPRHCVVTGGVNWVKMSGGNLNEQESLTDTQYQTTSSFTFLAMLIVTVLAVYTGGLAMGLAGPGAAAAISGAASMGAGTVAAIGGALYTGVSMAISGGTLCAACAQGNWLGNVSSGVAPPNIGAGGFGDPSAKIDRYFVSPGVGGGQQAAQDAQLKRNIPKTFNTKHSPAQMIANPPMRQGVMQGYISNPVR